MVRFLAKNVVYIYEMLVAIHSSSSNSTNAIGLPNMMCQLESSPNRFIDKISY